MNFHDLSIDGYIERASRAGDDERVVEMMLQAALVAEDRGDKPSAAKARMRAVNESHSADTPFETLAAFAYALHSEDMQDQWSLNWCYKWMFHRMIDVAAVPLSTVDRVFEMFEAHYEKASLGTSAQKQLKLELAVDTGRLSDAPALYEAWQGDTKTAGSDCRACQIDTKIQYHLAMGDLKNARSVGEPILIGKLRCASVPHITFARFVLPFLEAGDVEAAADVYRRGYSLVATERGYLNYASCYAIFLASTGNWREALSSVSARMYWTRTTRNDRLRFWSMLAAEQVFAAALRAGERVVPVSCVMPEPIRETDGLYDTQLTAGWFREQVDAIAVLFDTRNGTGLFSDEARRVRALLEQGVSLDLDNEEWD